MHLRRFLTVLLILFGLAGCGGGGGGSGPAPVPMSGTVISRTVASAITGSSYPLSIYLPPAGAIPMSNLPVVYALDGDWWFQELVSIAEETKTRMVIVGIGNNALRARDYAPVNTCNSSGGGNAAFFNFIRQELTPFVEGSIGGDPAQRVLIGHSFGGLFVVYAMFAEPPQSRHFRSYLASDSSLDCITQTLTAWEDNYAAAYGAMPARVHISHAGNAVNLDFARRLASHNYSGLVLKEQAYSGTHTGIIPAAFREAIAFGLSNQAGQ